MKNIIKIASVVILLAMVNNIFGQANNFTVWAPDNFPQDEVLLSFTYVYEDGQVTSPQPQFAPVNHYGASVVQYVSILRQQTKPGRLIVTAEDVLSHWWVKWGNPKTYYFQGNEYIEGAFHWEYGVPQNEDALGGE